jgi:hypothetical protein
MVQIYNYFAKQQTMEVEILLFFRDFDLHRCSPQNYCQPRKELAILFYVESQWLFEVRFYTFPVDEGFFGAERNTAVNAVIT